MKAITNSWSRQIDNKQAALEGQLLLLRRRKEHKKSKNAQNSKTQYPFFENKYIDPNILQTKTKSFIKNRWDVPLM